MEPFMKRIATQGICSLERLEGSQAWYWGADYASGDLYEAEELFRDGHPVRRNKLIFVRYPEGTVMQPVQAEEGQYLGRPIWYQGKIVLLLADFPAGVIRILQCGGTPEQVEPVCEIPLSTVKDCYNLLLKTQPLMLTRQGADDEFQILWPEQTSFRIGNTEAFLFRSGCWLYFSAWREDPEYREEILVRKLETGEILERIPGALMDLPDGQMWILT